MKKSILGLAVSAMFAFGAAQAATNDISSTLNISGNVTNSDTGCTVILNNNTVDISGDITTLATQGAPATPAKLVNMAITGGTVCNNLAEQNHIAYKLVGTADDADGNVLANSFTGEGAASGVGIGLYDQEGNVVAINSGAIAVHTPLSTPLGLALVKLTGQEQVSGTVQGSLTIQIERL